VGSPLDTGYDDPLIAKATAWIKDADKVEAIQRRWNDLESIVFDRAHALKMCCSDACRGDWPEAKEMRLLNRRIEIGYRRLESTAGKISGITAITPVGALSKIDLGLRWQGPYDWWKPYAYELMEEGIAEMRAMIAPNWRLKS
jgi:hypothetical protein